MTTNTTVKERMTKDELLAIVLGEGWGDSRQGGLYARVYTSGCKAPSVIVEIVWDDDGEDCNDASTFGEPNVEIEAFDHKYNDEATSASYRRCNVSIADAIQMMQGPASDVVERFKSEIAQCVAKHKRKHAAVIDGLVKKYSTAETLDDLCDLNNPQSTYRPSI